MGYEGGVFEGEDELIKVVEVEKRVVLVTVADWGAGFFEAHFFAIGEFDDVSTVGREGGFEVESDDSLHMLKRRLFQHHTLVAWSNHPPAVSTACIGAVVNIPDIPVGICKMVVIFSANTSTTFGTFPVGSAEVDFESGVVVV